MKSVIAILPLSLLLIGCVKDDLNACDKRRHISVDLHVPAALISIGADRAQAAIEKNLHAKVVRSASMPNVSEKSTPILILQAHTEGAPIPENIVMVETDGDSDDHEVVLRRIEKLALRPLSLAVGFVACQNPLCVLYPHTTLSDLDAKARDICPICSRKLSELWDSADRKVYLVVE